MAVANSVACNDTATDMSVKSFIEQVLSVRFNWECAFLMGDSLKSAIQHDATQHNIILHFGTE
jgi:hypothetical protein